MTKKTTLSLEDAIQAADDYREATVEITKIANQIHAKQAKVASAYEATLSDLAARQSEAERVLNIYANDNKATLIEQGKKSCDFAGLCMGYKKTPAKLIPNEGVDWDLVLERLRADRTLRRQYTKTKVEVDKTALKKADAEVLEEVGVNVVQVDKFFVKLKV